MGEMKIMKMKKALIGTMMAGALVIGAGASTGTYSDFFSEASSSGNKIELGTLKLQQTGDVGALLNGENLKPGSVVEGQSITVKNNGTLDGKLSVNVDSYILKDGNENNISDLSKYNDIKVGLYVNGSSIGEVPIGQLPALYDQANAYLAGQTLAAGQSYTIKPVVKVSRVNGDQNHLQGLKLSGNISWKLSQKD
ncbi:hypothetical protein FZC83_16895 [Rossellomorea marisflavi]|uniref:Uncharacterized protein n=2 Tax=Rossellomorea marisflavi TaxID=189381 RepID=A0A5D4RRV5_9BACI|nr:hypothetical protein FZC83_16895 [Rossellomorea marisflavi]